MLEQKTRKMNETPKENAFAIVTTARQRRSHLIDVRRPLICYYHSLAIARSFSVTQVLDLPRGQ